jgi:hypothetical protein
MFLLAIAGPRMLVAGAVFANTFIAQELTDYLTIGSHPTDPDRGLRRVAQVLATLQECIRDPSSFYNDLKFIEIPPRMPIPPGRGLQSRVREPSSGHPTLRYVPESPLQRWVFPCYTEFSVDGDRFSLIYERPLADGEEKTRALFMASMTSPLDAVGKPVVVKFTRSYCVEGHKLLAEMSLASKLLYHKHIAGVHFVVMEYLDDTGDPLTEAGHIESSRRAVRAQRDRKLVFGDLRGPNILTTKDGLKIVDFDWGGKEGTVHYPVDISGQIEWPEGVKGGGKIRAEHDEQWFKWLTGAEL